MSLHEFHPLTEQMPTLARQIGRTVRIVATASPKATMAAGGLLVLQGLLPLALLYFIKVTVDAVAGGASLMQAGIGLAGMGGIALASAICSPLDAFVRQAQSQIVSNHIQQLIQVKSVEMDLAYYEDAEYHDTLHRAQQEALYRPSAIVVSLMQFAQSSFSLLMLIGFIATIHWGLALILVAAAVPGVVLRLRHANAVYRWQRQHTATERMVSYLHMLVTLGAAAKEIRLFDLGHLFTLRFRDLNQKLIHERLQIAGHHAVVEIAAQTVAALAVCASYAFIVFQAVSGNISLGSLVVYYQAFLRGQSGLSECLNSLSSLYENSLFLSNFYEFLDLPSRRTAAPPPLPAHVSLTSGIVLEHVSFRYPTSARKALDDITLTIRPGEHVAIVGANGSGKTTLIKLLCRLYDPSEGRITLDGVDLSRLEGSALRSRFSVIFQDYINYHLTARENISPGSAGLSQNDERILQAARASGADAVIAGLPHAYDTILSNWFEEGEELSVGEWQKIALARCFVRDAPIIILDEPTSALDSLAEQDIFDRVRHLAAGKTYILINHRLCNVRDADCIYVLEGGKIAERGSHRELVLRGGTYARMYAVSSDAGNTPAEMPVSRLLA